MVDTKRDRPDPADAFREHGSALYRYLYGLTGDPEQAEDVAQEAYLKLLESESPKRNVRTWLFTVATRLVQEEARTRRRRRELEVGKRFAPPGPPLPDEEWERRRRIRRLRIALEELRERDRQILLMCEEGFSHAEVAEVVDVAASSVGKIAARALLKLGRAFERLDQKEERTDRSERAADGGGASG